MRDNTKRKLYESQKEFSIANRTGRMLRKEDLETVNYKLDTHRFRGKKYDYDIEIRWFDRSFDFLPLWRKKGVRQRSIWYMIENYTFIIKEWIKSFYGIDLAHSPTGSIYKFLRREGLIEISGNSDVPEWTQRKVEVWIEENIKAFFLTFADE